jgi:hypothetical protein
MIVVAALAVLVTIGRYMINQPGFVPFLASFSLFAAYFTIIVASEILFILLVALISYLLNPTRKHTDRPSQGRKPGRSGEAEKA